MLNEFKHTLTHTINEDEWLKREIQSRHEFIQKLEV